MVGRPISGAGRRLVLGVAVALALLVIVGRLQQSVMAPHRPAPALAPSATTTRPAPVTATIRLRASPAPPLAGEAQLMVGEGRLWAMLDGVLVAVDPGTVRSPPPGGVAGMSRSAPQLLHP